MAKTKEGTTSSTWTTSQENLAIEIIYLEGTGLNFCAQTNHLSLIEGRLLEREKGLAYLVHACHSTLSVFFFLIPCFFSVFVALILSHSFLSFSVLTRVVWWWCCNSLLLVTIVVMIPLCTARPPFYTACRDWFFTFLSFNYFCLKLSVLPDHPLVCQLPSHHHLPILAVPFSITRQRRLFCLLIYGGIFIHHSACILSCYPSWHAPNGSNSSFLLFGSMPSQQDISPKRIWVGTLE